MDILLNSDGEFEIGAWGDIATVIELEEIVQHIVIALLTWRGELRLHRLFGSNIYTLLGQINDAYLEPRASIYVQEALEGVPHVNRVNAVRVYEDEEDANTYQLKVVVEVDLHGKTKNILINVPADT